jgi:hypothetical protein
MVLYHFGASHAKMLMAVFPDIGLQEHKFNKMPSKFGERELKREKREKRERKKRKERKERERKEREKRERKRGKERGDGRGLS